MFVSPHIRRLIDMALDEDHVGLDVTSQIFFEGASAHAELVAKQPLVLAGSEVAEAVFARVDPSTSWTSLHEDGASVSKGDVLATISGDAVALLGAERIALNFLQRMSGIATLTSKMVGALDTPSIRLADTRKTLPGYRELDKYAVRCGGGFNHRLSLSGGVMLKENHIRAARGSIAQAVEIVRARAPHTTRIEVETTSIEEVQHALSAQADIIMLDNMSIEQMEEAIALIRSHDARVVIEASGNVTLERLPQLSSLDLDVISVGAITHSVEAADISMLFRPESESRSS